MKAFLYTVAAVIIVSVGITCLAAIVTFAASGQLPSTLTLTRIFAGLFAVNVAFAVFGWIDAASGGPHDLD